MGFVLEGDISSIEVIAIGPRIREVARLKKAYGGIRWRKLKGVATVRFGNGQAAKAEVHWYEAHGVGRKEMKIKRVIREH